MSRTDTVEPGTLVGECPECGPVYGDSVHLSRVGLGIEADTRASCNLCGATLNVAALADEEVEVPEQIARVNIDG
jgi:hypothetical protein